MPHLIKKLQGDKAKLVERLNDDAILLGRSMDIKRLLEDPTYIQDLSREFVAQHRTEIAAALAMGAKFGETILSSKTLDE